MGSIILGFLKTKGLALAKKHWKLVVAITVVTTLLPIFIIVVVPLTVAVTVYDAILDFFGRKDEMTEYNTGYIEAELDPELYDVEAAKAWAEKDPDMTTIMYSTLKEARPVVMADDYKWKEETDPNKKLWYEILRDDNVYVDDSNMESILQYTFDYNIKMFEWEKVYYENFGYIHDHVVEHDIDGNVTDDYWHWATEEPIQNTTDDERWGLASREKVEGEEDEDGYKKFQMHWQDAMAYAMFFGYQNIDEYKNNKDDSPYKPSEGEYEVNDTVKYFMKDDEVQYILDLFRYEFDYSNEPGRELGYDVVGGATAGAEDGKDHNTESTIYNWDESYDEPRKLKEGTYTLAYRYEREGPEPAGYEPQTHYATEGEMESPPVYTWMTPEASLIQINNSYDHYVYQYINTADVPDYTPDPENYEPPEGWYCVGRWHYIDPYKFIMSMAKMCPEYRDRYKSQEKNDKAGEHFLENYQGGYEWSYQMMDFYCQYLEMFEDAGLNERSSFFFELEELYRKIRDTGEIYVEYEGVDVEPEMLEGMKKEIAYSIRRQDPYVEKVIFPDESFAYFTDPEGDSKVTPGDGSMKSKDPSVNLPPIGKSDTSKGAIPYSQADLDAMIRTVVGEAGNQGIEGMKTVAEVIYNRVISNKFPNTVQGVCTAGNGRQFNGWKVFKNTPISELKRKYPGCEEACRQILAGGKSVLNNTNIIGFKSDKNTPGWNRWGNYNTGNQKIYGHYFYYLPDGKNDPSIDNAQASTAYKYQGPEKAEGSGSTGSGASGVTIEGGSGMPKSYKVITWDEELELRYCHDETQFPFASLGVTFRQAIEPAAPGETAWPEDPGGYEFPPFEPFEFTGDGKLLDMFEYYNQGDPRWAGMLRGASNETVQKGGCLDSSTAMIIAYYLRRSIHVGRDVSKYVGADEQLDQHKALAAYGLKRGDNIYSNFKQGVKNEIDAGRPTIIHIRGQWYSKEDGRALHSTKNGHFMVAVGYNKKGIYVYDPGKKANRLISWDDWDHVGDRYYRPVYKK